MFALVGSLFCVSLSASLGVNAWHFGSRVHQPQHHYKCLETPNTAAKVTEAMPKCADSVKANIIEEAFTIVRYQWDHLEQPHDQQNLAHLPQNHYAHPPPIDNELLRHVHHVHRLPGQLHQHQAQYPPLATGHSHSRRPSAAASSDSQPLDANSLFEYQHFDENLQMRRHDRQLHFGHSDHHQSADWQSAQTAEISLQEKRIAGCLLHCVFSKNHAVDGLGWPTLDGLVGFFSDGVHDHGYFLGTLRAVNTCLGKLSHAYRVKRWQSPEHGESCDLSFDLFNCISDNIAEYCSDHQHRESFSKTAITLV